MADILPIHYKVHLEPNLETFVFKGVLELEISSSEPVNNVTLNTFEITYQKVEVDFGEGYLEVQYEEDMSKREMHITLPDNNSSLFTLKFSYTGKHNDDLAGFYRSKFKVNGKEEYCAVTQFQADDARRAFPCFDVPGIKATFDVEFLMDKDLMAISNMPIKHEEEVDGKKLVQFERTPRMSTYLVFFAVGNFEFIEKSSNDIHYRLIASPDKASKYGQLSLDFGVDVVEFCEKYFGYEYPLPKLDQIATPDFAAGAMENWGAILYRENALLYYPGITSEAQLNAILGVVSHEIIHQWFGNLVSPMTWKYLWLNESFATYFGNYVVDQLKPERKTFQFFVQSTNLARRSRATAGVMEWDGMCCTSPIEIEGDGTISFTAKTVPILYQKGGSILRQIHGYLGEDEFRDGLRSYFQKHAYTATVSPELWEALEEATGKPVSKIMESFVMQKGLPIIKVEKEGTVLHLSQQRFTYLFDEDENMWNIPLTFRVFRGDKEEIMRYVLEERKGEFDLREHDAFKVNIDLTGFYRVQYEKEEYEMLAKLIREKKIGPIERMHVEDDLYALLKAGKVSLYDYLEFVDNYKDEDSHMSILNIAGHLNDIIELLEDPDRVRPIATQFITGVFEKIGYDPVEGEDLGISIIRGSLIRLAVAFGSEEAEKYALDLYQKIKNNEQISADLRATALSIGAKKLNEFDYFMERFNNPESESEFLNTINAMGNFSDKELLEKVKDMVFNEVPSRNRGFLIAELANNKLIKDDIWHWYLANLDAFEALNNFMYQGSILAVVRCSEKHKDDMEGFFEEQVKKNPRISDAVEVAMEQLEINLAFKAFIN